MTLARVRNPEALRYQAPGEWGAILGLDRCPEAKTLRRKLRLLASAEHTVRDWQAELARSWASEHDDDWATLAVDGHVKVYAGRNGRLPKHFVARQKAVFAGVRELTGSTPSAERPCCACTRRWTRSWSRRSSTTWCPTWWNWAWCRKRPPT